MLRLSADWRNVLTAAIALTAGAWPLAASAACTPPQPPYWEGKSGKPALPQKPACLSTKDGCPGWEAYSYNDAVKAYNVKAEAYRPAAEAYVKQLNDYVKAASEYAQCEVKSLQ